MAHFSSPNLGDGHHEHDSDSTFNTSPPSKAEIDRLEKETQEKESGGDVLAQDPTYGPINLSEKVGWESTFFRRSL